MPCKSNDLISTPRTLVKVERENQFHKTLLWTQKMNWNKKKHSWFISTEVKINLVKLPRLCLNINNNSNKKQCNNNKDNKYRLMVECLYNIYKDLNLILNIAKMQTVKVYVVLFITQIKLKHQCRTNRCSWKVGIIFIGNNYIQQTILINKYRYLLYFFLIESLYFFPWNELKGSVTKCEWMQLVTATTVVIENMCFRCRSWWSCLTWHWVSLKKSETIM